MLSLETQFRNLKLQNIEFEKSQIYPLVDLTLLKENATKEEILSLTKTATKNKVAAICIYPKQLLFLPSSFKQKKATVINFPNGNEQNNINILETLEAITIYNCDEIDYVFPYDIYLQNDKNKALKYCDKIYQLCHKHKKIFKVIIETSMLQSPETIYTLSSELIQQGVDFIKTSTGKTPVGATIEASFAILLAIKNSKANCGIKVSGGIKNFQQASNFIQLAETVLEKNVSQNWFRIGASNLT